MFTSNLIGKIESVYCKNFVTYKECSFYPTEYLNVIIGPNGTGKSTLVAAIIIGLGGDPKLLSRAPDIKSYIKNDETDALIKVNIYTSNRGKITSFQRSFNNDNKSEFKIDGEIHSRAKFLAVVASYKIQVSNLCQFLPQDRVQDFAKMNPQELLHNTIISVCSEDIINMFKQLKELQKLRSVNKTSSEANKKKLDEAIARADELKQALHLHEAREEYAQKLDVCNAKMAWISLDDIKAKIQEYDTDLKAAKKAMAEHNRRHADTLKKQQEIGEKTESFKKNIEMKDISLKQLVEKNTKIDDELEKFNKHLRESKLKLEREKGNFLERECELKREADLLKLTMFDIHKAKTQIQTDIDAKIMTNCDVAIDKLRCQEREYKTSNNNICAKLDEITPEIEMLKSRLSRMRNNKEQRLQLLQSKYPDEYAIVQWLRQQGTNSNMFIGKIYEPMILELTLPDQNKAKYLENTVPERDLIAFTCEEKSDCSKLQNVAISQNLRINIVHSAAARECMFQPPDPIDNYKKYGFTGYLLDLVNGPPAILNYLCSLYHIHCIPIGNDNVSRCTDHINHKLYYGGDQKYVNLISKYSKQSSLMQSTIFPKKLFSSITEQDVQKANLRLQELVRKSDSFKNERTAINVKMDELLYALSEERKKKSAVQENINRFNQLRDKMKRQEEKVDRLKNNTTTIEEMEMNFKTTVTRCLRTLVEFQKLKINVVNDLKDAVICKRNVDTEFFIFNQQHQHIRNEINEAQERKKNTEELLQAISNSLDKSKQKYRQKMLEAKALTNNVQPTSSNYPHKDLYLSLPSSKEEIKNQINEYNARLDCMGDVDKEVVTEYRNKTDEIDALKAAINDELQEDRTKKGEIDRIYNDWYPTIDQIITSLNTQFSDFMQSMDFVGEVLLRKKDEYDFDTYGIDIMVQYRRNVPLKALDRNVQSGGERAVAIAIYTLSLQHLTHVPFRCVDEINQGMDPRNERIVFNMLVNETTKDGSSQYFFVTPKLLHNLEYNDRMSVHIVFNGATVQANVFKSSLA